VRILDRERVKAFVKAYVICFVALVGLYIVFDAFTNLDEFAEVVDGTGALLAKMGRYYAVRLSQFYDRLCGVIGMMAAIFTVTWMQRDNELLAINAAGVSTHRAIRPVIVCAALVSVLAVANQELIIPRVATELQLPPDDDGKRELRVSSRTDVNDIIIHGVHGFRETKTVEPFDATLPPNRFGTLHNLEAKEARYIAGDDGRWPLRGGWLLRGARLSPAGVEPDNTLLIPVADEDLTDFPPPRNAPEKLASGSAYFLRSNITFEDATRSRLWYNYAGTPDLLHTLREPIGPTEKMEIGVFLHARLLRPLLSMTLLFLSLPLVLGGGSRGMFINLGLSLGTSAVFYAALFLFQYLGNNRVLGPELSAWAPLMGFGTVAAGRWGRIRT
jgi:lipopolysaccharide export system permease protein